MSCVNNKVATGYWAEQGRVRVEGLFFASLFVRKWSQVSGEAGQLRCRAQSTHLTSASAAALSAELRGSPMPSLSSSLGSVGNQARLHHRHRRRSELSMLSGKKASEANCF